MRFRWAHALIARLKAVCRPWRAEQDLDDELAFHVAMQSRANEQQGMGEIEARRRAQIDLGGVQQVKERSRDARPLRWARDAAQDTRYAVRSLWKTPRFTIAALLTVVLGVGANATIFGALNPLLFKPLPYREPDRIVNVFRTSPQSQRWPFSIANYYDQRDRSTSFESLTAMTWRDTSLAEPGQPAERVFSIRATGSFFALFGVPPLLGRSFTDNDDRAGGEPVVVLSYGFWQRRFAGDRGIVGRRLRLDGETATVVGVMHSVLVDWDVFVKVVPPGPDPRTLYKPADFDFQLRPGSVAIDAGVRIPGVNDDFTGRAPDLGAYEVGLPVPHYGVRP